MPDSSGESVPEVDWEHYYRAVEGRPLRPLFVEAFSYLPTRPRGEGPLVAVDLGCGDGTETLELLARGWAVLAVDRTPGAVRRLCAAVSPGDAARLTTRVASFAEVELPEADFVYAGLSLPFCSPADFDEAWRRITTAVRPTGVVAGHLFGPRDSWAATRDMTFHTRDEVELLLRGLEIESLHEQDEDGEAVSGPKHWHVFHVIARKPSPRGSQQPP